MKIAIVGTGYVGLVTGTCFAEMGTEVFCVDVDKNKIDNLKKGIVPIYEPGLDELVARNMQAGRLHFTTELKECLGRYMNKYILVVTKSTVPVGTAQKVKQAIKNEQIKRNVNIEFDIASNPEFLKEGAAVKDFMSPDRVVVGVESERAEKLMSKLYRPFLLNNFRVIFMDVPSAEMTKYAANAMLATRISFMNDIANLCEIVGADVNMVRKGIGTDARIGSRFLYAGCGYGGSCFPKDVKALMKTAADSGYQMRILEAVEAVNEEQKSILFRKLVKHFNGDIKGKRIALWGLAFKPETDDMREAPSLVLIEKLRNAGCLVSAYDPVAIPEAQRRLPEDVISYVKDIYEAVIDADALLLVTEWKEFRMPSWSVIKKLMATPLILDGRNIYDKAELEEAGFIYHCIGR